MWQIDARAKWNSSGNRFLTPEELNGLDIKMINKLFNNYFEEMGNIALDAKAMLESGNIQSLGKLMNVNQEYLRKIGVSHPSIEKLIEVAIQNGAYGAKLCGGGLGGNIVVLINENSANQMMNLLLSAGATEIIYLKLGTGEF